MLDFEVIKQISIADVATIVAARQRS